VQTAHLILIRHGHTSSNDGGGHVRLSGWTDVPLSASGHREAALVARRIACERPIAAVYASPLQRARVTASYVSESTGAAMILDPDLREIRCGSADGRTVDEVRAAHPEVWEHNLRQDDDDFRWPGGESYREFRERCVRAARAIAARHGGERVAMVTHAGVITQLVGSLRGVPAARWLAHRAGNASITHMEWGGDRARVIRFDDRDHLAGLDPVQQTTPLPRAG
jgi:alpha-ribazole phosphatase/probable phosphoglycerate mutase